MNFSKNIIAIIANFLTLQICDTLLMTLLRLLILIIVHYDSSKYFFLAFILINKKNLIFASIGRLNNLPFIFNCVGNITSEDKHYFFYVLICFYKKKTEKLLTGIKLYETKIPIYMDSEANGIATVSTAIQ